MRPGPALVAASDVGKPVLPLQWRNRMASRSARCIAALPALAVFAAATPVYGQSGLESAIQQYSGVSIRGYIQPLADALVANLSLGFINSAAPPSKFSLSLEAVAMTAALDENMRSYT